MRGILVAAITMAVAASALAQTADREVIAQDTAGVVVIVKEQYGGTVLDTCTVVMVYQNSFVLVHRNTGASWYPVAFNSISVVERLSQRVVATDGSERLAGNVTEIGMVVSK